MTEYTDHHAPDGPRVRGTIVVVPGRGETRTTYERLGRRLAADAYRVRVIDPPQIAPADPIGSLTRFGAALADAVDGAAAHDGAAAVDGAASVDRVVRPVVLIGADTGAAAVAALLNGAEVPTPWKPDAVVLAGLPGRAATAAGTWDEELDVRTSCPTHRGTLAQDPAVRRGALHDAVPEALLTVAHADDITVPVLLLVGDADPLADRQALTHSAKSLPRARLSVVRGAHHDVLNDLQHRTVAAEIVTFLETLRNDLAPLIAVESSAW